MFFVILIFLVSLFFLTRILFIIFGLYKTPVIQTFEWYGPEEKIYYPVPELVLWLGIFILTGSPWIAVFVGYNHPISWPGLLLLLTWWYIRQHPELPERYPILTWLPEWYRNLRSRTNRYERRRIGYMWLRLPARTRMLFHSNDTAFAQWADLVVMAWVQDEEDFGE
jgi:hypothetical protein